MKLKKPFDTIDRLRYYASRSFFRISYYFIKIQFRVLIFFKLFATIYVYANKQKNIIA